MSRKPYAAVLAAVFAVSVAACDGDPPPRAMAPSADSGPTSIPGVYAYSESTSFSVMIADQRVVTVDSSGAADADWAVDGSRVVMADGTKLVSVDTVTGEVTETACECNDIGLAGDRVYAVAGYQAMELKVFDAVTLTPAEDWRPEITGIEGIFRVEGAGPDLVIFATTDEGATTTLTDVYVADPDGDRLDRVGSTDELGTVYDTAYTPNGPGGRPAFAYEANAHGSWCVNEGSVAWFDPSTDDPQVVTDSTPLTALDPAGGGGSEVSSSWGNLWWDADGELNATGSTWTCDGEVSLTTQPMLNMRVEPSHWRLGADGWAQVDPTVLEAVRSLTGGSRLELTVNPDGGLGGKQLTLVQGNDSTVVSSDADRLWTPPIGAAASSVDTVSANLAQQYAPRVWLAEGEEFLPGSAGDYLAQSRLDWVDGCATDTMAEIGQIDVPRLADGGYSHTQSSVSQFPPPCASFPAPVTWATDVPTRPRAADGPPGAQGFVLDGEGDGGAEDTLHRGMPLADGSSSAPVYVQSGSFEEGDGSYLVYWFFYPWNDFDIVLPGGKTIEQGFDHEGDWERVLIRFDSADQPVTIVYKGHGATCAMPWGEAPRDEEGHPVVYSAKGTHASYPTDGEHKLDHATWDPPGPIGRIVAPVSDHTSAGGSWETWDHLVDVQSEGWWGYAGGWGELGLISDQTGPSGPNPIRDMATEARDENGCG